MLRLRFNDLWHLYHLLFCIEVTAHERGLMVSRAHFSSFRAVKHRRRKHSPLVSSRGWMGVAESNRLLQRRGVPLPICHINSLCSRFGGPRIPDWSSLVPSGGIEPLFGLSTMDPPSAYCPTFSCWALEDMLGGKTTKILLILYQKIVNFSIRQCLRKCNICLVHIVGYFSILPSTPRSALSSTRLFIHISASSMCVRAQAFSLVA